MNRISFENGCTSPDGKGNPFVAGFATKDWKEQQEIASKQLQKSIAMSKVNSKIYFNQKITNTNLRMRLLRSSQ
ncbi:hypothetical protein BXU10_13530 [Flavobacterium sp. LM4]|nr:hypothetical protein BXU10_13530 [Flavobacterium sp. LM4]